MSLDAIVFIVATADEGNNGNVDLACLHLFSLHRN